MRTYPSRFWGAAKCVAALLLKTNKKNYNTIGRKRRLMNMTTNRSPRKTSSTSLKHSAARTYLKTVSFLFLPQLISIWSGGKNRKSEEKARELFGIKEDRQKEKKREETLIWDCPPVDSGSFCEAVGGEELVGMGWSQHVWLTGEWSCWWDQGHKNKGKKGSVELNYWFNWQNLP